MKISNWPQYTKKEIEIVSNILKSGKVNYWTGERIKSFEKKFSKKFGLKYSIAVMNGSIALDLSVKSLNIQKNSEVLVSPKSFIASVNCIVLNNLLPVFIDVDLNSQNIDYKKIESKISSKTRAIICVHLGGYPCNMPEIMKIAKKYNLFVIEDCSQAHGAKIKNRHVGTFGNIATWSFCNDKIISTAGEGGMISTNDQNLSKKIWSLRDHGKSFDRVHSKKHPIGFRWLHENISSNYRMTEIQAGIGEYQLSKLDYFVKKRIQISKKLKSFISNYQSFKNQKIEKGFLNSQYKFYFFINTDFTNIDNIEVLRIFSKTNIPITVGSCSEIYREKAYSNHKIKLKNSSYLSKYTLAISISHIINNDQIDKLILQMKKIFKKNNIK